MSILGIDLGGTKGEGIAKVARDHLTEDSSYSGLLRSRDPKSIIASDIFNGFEAGDPLAVEVIEECIEFWGMAVDNLVSLFNPENIILGGGVFGPALRLIPEIVREASRWAQPLRFAQMTLEVSSIGGDAGVYGAGYLALRNLNEFIPTKSYHVQ